MMVLLVLAVLAAAPSPDNVRRSFGDWTSVCDNGLRCQVSTIMGQARNIGVHMDLRRDAGPGSRIEVGFWSSSGWRARRASVRMDGRTFPLFRQGTRLVVPPRSAVAAARAAARARSIHVHADGERFPISARGSSAALRDMDARQGRAGTVTAIVATGPAPASSVPPPPPLPVITERRRPTRGLVIRPSAQLLAEWRREEDCDAQMNPADYPTQSWALDQRTAVILVMCYPGGRNNHVLVKVGRRADGSDARAARFDHSTSIAERSGPTAAPDNPERDESTGRLVSGQRGGIAYASTRETWAWDGQRFRLIERWGSYGSTFRARVRQR